MPTCKWCHKEFVHTPGSWKPREYCCESHRVQASKYRSKGGNLDNHKPWVARVRSPLDSRLPAGPLLDALQATGITALAAAQLADLPLSVIDKARWCGFFPLWAIDQISVKALNRHPTETYGDAWLEEDCRSTTPEIVERPRPAKAKVRWAPTSLLDMPWSSISDWVDDDHVATSSLTRWNDDWRGVA